MMRGIFRCCCAAGPCDNCLIPPASIPAFPDPTFYESCVDFDASTAYSVQVELGDFPLAPVPPPAISPHVDIALFNHVFEGPIVHIQVRAEQQNVLFQPRQVIQVWVNGFQQSNTILSLGSGDVIGIRLTSHVNPARDFYALHNGADVDGPYSLGGPLGFRFDFCSKLAIASTDGADFNNLMIDEIE